MVGTLSARDDPECPACGSAIFTEPTANANDDKWVCWACKSEFEPDGMP